jgi:PAS domain S-box-containing protein
MTTPINNAGNSLASMWMSSTFLGDLIVQNRPDELARHLCEQLRELTGAETVAFYLHTENHGNCEPLYVCPTHRVELFSTSKLSLLCPVCNPAPIPPRREDLPEDDPLRKQLDQAGFANILRLPIHSAGQLAGSFVIADLPDLEQAGEIRSMMEFLGPAIGLAIRNCSARKKIQQNRDSLEALVEARTAELKQANQELNDSRLAALNMMEDAMLAKQRLELTQFALNHADTAVFWICEDATIRYANHTACQNLGYTEDELTRLSIPDIDPFISRQSWPDQWSELKQKRSLHFEMFLKRKDGSGFPAEIYSSYIKRQNAEYIFAFAHDISDRKTMEQQLKLTQFAVDHLNDNAYWADETGRLKYVNLSTCSVLDYTKDELLQMYIWDVDPEVSAEDWPGALARIKEGGHALFESVLRRKDGSTFPVEVKINYIEFGDLKLACGFAHDITERKQSARRIEFEQSLFRSFMETLPASVYFKDCDGRFLRINQCMADAFGISKDAMIGKTDFDFYPPEQARKKFDDELLVMESRRPIRIEEPHYDRCVMTTKAPRYDEKGNLSGTFGISWDITERKEAEQQLLQSKKKIEGIFSAAPIGIGLTVNRVIMEANKQLCNMLGYSAEEIIGKSARMLYRTQEEFLRIGREKYQQIYNSGIGNVQTCWKNKNGEIIDIQLSSTPLNIDAPEDGIIFTALDITERMRMQAAIEKRILALTRPLGSEDKIEFEELFNLPEIQRIQDEFAAATGVASIITLPDGTPLTKPSNFTCLCNDIIRRTDVGCANCIKSDAAIGRHHPEGPVIHRCLSSGLWDAGASIAIGGRHIANWLIGQVRDETQTDDAMRAYAQTIGADVDKVLEAYHRVPVMSLAQFEKIANALFTLVGQLSTSAFQNIQQARFITEQKQTQQALRESQEHLEVMWNAMNVGIVLVDAETRVILRANPAILSISGWREEDLVGKRCLSVLCPSDEGACPVGDLGKTLDRSERKLIHAGGYLIDIEKTVTPIEIGGSPVYLETVFDITERKKAEAELRRLSTAITQSPEAIVITDPKGSIEYVNPAFETITGYTREEAIGKNPRILKSGEHPCSFYAELWETIASGGTWQGRFVNKKKNGCRYDEEAVISPVTDASGAITNYVAVKRDITRELVHEDELRQAQKMDAIGQLAGGIAHDFNNILQGIMGFSEMLEMDLEPQSAEYASNQEIHKAAKRATQLTRQLLAFSRKQSSHLETMDLNSSVHDAQALLNILLGENYEIVMDLQDEVPPIYADPGQLTQIIMNLAVNARDAMPEGGRLTISTGSIEFSPEDIALVAEARAGNFVCLSVTDTGTGMDPQTKSRLFEPFFTTKAVGAGTGLGLSVVYGIVKQSRGWINIYSEKGKGSCFKIFFPESAPLQSGSAEEPQCLPKHLSATILLVEDDPEIAAMAVEILSSSELNTLLATNAEEALEMFRERNGEIDLLISDMELPGIRGDELADELRKTNPNLLVLLMSGYHDQESRWKHLAERDYSFVKKPFAPSAFIAIAEQLIKESKERDKE